MTIKIINPIDALLRFAIRLAHRRWNDRTRIPDGVPGVRDARHPCECYSPMKRLDVLGKHAPGCQGDGHYLCRECRWLVKDEDATQHPAVPGKE